MKVIRFFPLLFYVNALAFLVSCKSPNAESRMKSETLSVSVINSKDRLCSEDGCKSCKIPEVPKNNAGGQFSIQDFSRKPHVERLIKDFDASNLSSPYGNEKEKESSFEVSFNQNSPLLIQRISDFGAKVDKYKYFAELRILFKEKLHSLKYELYAMEAPTFSRFLYASAITGLFEGMEIGKIKIENSEAGTSHILASIGSDITGANIPDSENVILKPELKNGETLGCGDLVFVVNRGEFHSGVIPTKFSWYPCNTLRRARTEPKFYEGTWPEPYRPMPFARLASDPKDLKAHELLLKEIEVELSKDSESSSKAVVKFFNVWRECDCCFNPRVTLEPWGLVEDRNFVHSLEKCDAGYRLLSDSDFLGPQRRLFKETEDCPDLFVCHFKKDSKKDLYCKKGSQAPMECSFGDEKDSIVPPLLPHQTEIKGAKIPYNCFKQSGDQPLLDAIEKEMKKEKAKQLEDQRIKEKYPLKRPENGPIH